MTSTAINHESDTAAASDAAGAPVAISVSHVSKTYPVPLDQLKRALRLKRRSPVEALRDVSFDVREGEVFGLIGRNGAGKTTLAKIVATLVQPTSGAVTVRGFDSVRADERVRAQVGLASAEERSFYWRLTVEQNLMFFARLYGLGTRAARRRIGELVERFELGDLRRRRFGELSTGNKQRMSVARAMLNSPPVLLLDEPTRSLDPVAAARMREVIGSLARSDPPATVLLTSHNLAEVEELCERVAVIHRGTLRALDTPSNLRARHRRRERVRLRARGVTPDRAARLLEGVAESLETSEEGGDVVVGFWREAADASLDRALRALLDGGAQVVDCETERGTLLDVLESYEREGEAEGQEGRGAESKEAAKGEDGEGGAGARGEDGAGVKG